MRSSTHATTPIIGGNLMRAGESNSSANGYSLDLNVLHFIGLASLGGAERYFSECVRHIETELGGRQSVFVGADGIHPFIADTLQHDWISIYRKKYWGVMKLPRYPASIREYYWARIARQHAPGIGLFWNQLRAPREAAAVQAGGLRAVYWERGTGWHTSYSDPAATAMLDSVDAVLANSEAGKRILRARGFEKAVHVCRNAVRPQIFERVATPRQAPVGRPFHLGLAARLVPYKGTAVALHTLKELRDEGLECRLAIAGTGPDLSVLRTLASSLGVERHLDFLGVVDDMLAFFDQIDCLLHPALCEPCSNTVAEAICRGCPVVATNVDGMPEVMSDKCGTLVPPTLPAEDYVPLGVQAVGQPPLVFHPDNAMAAEPRAPSPKDLAQGVMDLASSAEQYAAVSRFCVEWAVKTFDPRRRYGELAETLRRIAAP